MSSLGSVALLATLLRYWVLLPLVLVIAAWTTVLVYLRCQPKYREMIRDDTKGRVTVGLIEMNEFNIAEELLRKMVWLILTLLLTDLTITANVHPSLKMPGIAWEVCLKYLFLDSNRFSQEHRLSDVAIVEKVYLLNSIFTVTLAAYILDTFLFYFKTWKPFWEAEAKAKAPKSLDQITFCVCTVSFN